MLIPSRTKDTEAHTSDYQHIFKCFLKNANIYYEDTCLVRRNQKLSDLR